MIRGFRRMAAFGLSATALAGCGSGPAPASPAKPASSSAAPSTAQASPSKEPHLKQLRQLTNGGENAEAYWSFDGKQLIFQAHQGEGCDQIYRMPLGQQPVRVSTGKGSTTCAYFLPGDQQIIYAS